MGTGNPLSMEVLMATDGKTIQKSMVDFPPDLICSDGSFGPKTCLDLVLSNILYPIFHSIIVYHH
jgi:hypothetical protein